MTKDINNESLGGCRYIGQSIRFSMTNKREHYVFKNTMLSEPYNRSDGSKDKRPI